MNVAGIVNLVLLIILIILLIIGIKKLRRKKLLQSAGIFLVFAIGLCYWIMVRERIILVSYVYRPFPQVRQAFTSYIVRYHRYPMNIEELISDTISIRFLNEPCSYSLLDKPFFLKEPNYGIRTVVNDTLISTSLYSYGLDYDDDQLKKEYYLGYYLPSRQHYTQYILSPLPLDGDIYIIGWERSIWDPFFDTVFVRQMFELQGDTLSPEEYEAWLKKRKEYR